MAALEQRRDDQGSAAAADWRQRAIILYDPAPFTRRLILDVLRNAGGVAVRGSSDPDSAARMCLYARNPILLAGWSLEEEGALRFLRAVRRHHTSRREAPAVLLSSRASHADVEAARDAGADTVLLRPVSPKALIERLDHAARVDRPFIDTPGYVGPDRRRSREPDPHFTVVFKRDQDVEAGHVAPFRALLNQADQIAVDMMRSGDSVGARVGRSLRRYLEIHGPRGGREPEIIQLHRSAVSRLKELRAAPAPTRVEIVTGLERIVASRAA